MAFDLEQKWVKSTIKKDDGRKGVVLDRR